MKTTTLIAASLLTAGLGGCDMPEHPSTVDQCMRREIFTQCMAALPAGPLATKYNDWAEVVIECESAAIWQSKRSEEFVKPECKIR